MGTKANPIQIAAKLYDNRDMVRDILGPKFKATMADYGHTRELPPTPYICSKCSPTIEDGARPF